jgi:Protein of unknown function (DUF2844)
MKRITSVLMPFFMLVGAVLSSSSVHATLGESADSVAADRKELSAVQRATTVHNGYTVQMIVSDATTVREYVSPSGIVFGIAWNGLVHPDVTRLLGSYSGEFTQALKRSPRKPGSRRQQVNTGRLVVEKWGHMRNLQGRAYDPNLLPPGASSDDIK